MVPAPTSFTKDYQLLREAADALGFTRETQLLERRRFDLNQPFTLLIAGKAGSGKSNLINQLLGREIAAPKVGNGWVNVYHQVGEAAEYAEVYTMTDDAEVPQVVPIEQAATMGRSSWPFEEGSLDDIEQIVWHLDAPALPEYMALAEAPTTTDFTLPNASVDGIMWVTKALAPDQVPTTALSTFSGPPPSFSVLGVLTHLDTLPEDKREACRVAMQAQMPLSVTSVVDAPPPDTPELARTALFRAVRDRFMLPAQQRWQRQHQQFIGHMNQVIATRFELFADRVLERHWTFNRFRDHMQRTLREEVHTLAELIGQQIQHTQDHALAVLTEGQAPLTPAPMPLADRLTNASAYLEDRAQTLLGELRVDHVPATELSAADVARYANSEAVLAALDGLQSTPLALPEPPTQTIAPISRLLPPSEDGAPSTALTKTEPEIMALVDTGVHALATWLRSARTAVQEQVWQKANALYQALHGFFVEDTVTAMQRLEAYYMRLKAKALYVPTPHLEAEGLTPFQFLANMQDAAFIQHWNKRYVREASNSLVAHLQSQSAKMLAAGEEHLQAIWSGYAEPLHAKIKAIWTNREAKWKPYGNAIWSLRQLMNDIPDAQSATPFTTLPAVQAPLTAAPSLLLTEQAEAFLQRASDLADATPEAELADSLNERLQGRIRPEAERVWNRHQPILMRLSGEEPLRRSSLTMGVLFAVLAGVWFAVAGISSLSLAVFGLYTLIHVGAAAWLSHTVIARHIDVHAELETEGLHEAVRIALAERFTHLKTYVQRTLENATFRDELEDSVLTRTLAPVPIYVGYGDLTRRLSTLANQG